MELILALPTRPRLLGGGGGHTVLGYRLGYYCCCQAVETWPHCAGANYCEDRDIAPPDTGALTSPLG